MRNIAAIVGKEFRSYFASPIAYIVLGFFALLYGWFFVAILSYFLRQSMQMMGAEAQANVNQQMIRPLLSNVGILILFMLPMVTMRSYAEEKRSGTIELLLTSPLTDFQIIMGKFLGALALYGIMLLLSLVHIGILFAYGRPAIRELAVAYLGLLLLGSCFISVGLFVSSLTKNQIVAVAATFGTFLLLWVVDWLGTSVGATGQQITSYLSIIQQYDDFGKGVIDTSHVIYYLSFITFGLFLTAKSLDSERWRG